MTGLHVRPERVEAARNKAMQEPRQGAIPRLNEILDIERSGKLCGRIAH